MPYTKNKIVGNITYSVVIPFYNEEYSVEELLNEVDNIMNGLGAPYEIIAVNDGSTDRTGEKLEKIRSRNLSISPVNFSSRRGQTASLAEGFRKARGNIIISMDGDLQDDPREIPSMLDVFEKNNFDVVCGWRRNRHDSPVALLFSRLGNFFQKIFLNVPVHDISCTFRIYKRAVIKNIELKKEGLHRFLPFILKKAGFSLGEKEVNQRPRKYGSSKYSSRKAVQTIKLFFEILAGEY